MFAAQTAACASFLLVYGDKSSLFPSSVIRYLADFQYNAIYLNAISILIEDNISLPNLLFGQQILLSMAANFVLAKFQIFLLFCIILAQLSIIGSTSSRHNDENKEYETNDLRP